MDVNSSGDDDIIIVNICSANNDSDCILDDHDYLKNEDPKEEIVKGYLKSENDFNNFLTALKKIGFSYSIRDSIRYSGERYLNNNEKKLNSHQRNTGDNSCRRFIRFDPVSGLPFIHEKRIIMQCAYGDKYYKTSIRDEDRPRKRQRASGNTKKLGCKSEIIVKVRHMFVGDAYCDAASKSEWKKRKISEELHQQISQQQRTNLETWYFVAFKTRHNHPGRGHIVVERNRAGSSELLNKIMS